MDQSKSERWARRLEDVIPWGSSTCSKAATLLPEEPGVIVRGEGCRVWDADGREFIDYRNSLGPVTLGYRFPAVDKAIRKQLNSGIIFGHPHPIEGEVAELLRDAIPCAERVRFLKTGGEAIAACIRLARCHTGRDHVVQIGYNGWLNSLAKGGRVLPRETASSAPPGVPQALSDLHHVCDWNDEEAVRATFTEHGDRIAAIVVASDYENPEAGESFYPFLRQVTDRHGAVLVYDEIVTGFRVAVAGVQERFGVVPDMAVFAKGMANGMPLSAYVGKAEVMDNLREAIVSSTYAGETLSLAAAKAAIETYRSENVIAHLWAKGLRLMRGLDALFEERSLPIRMAGYACCPTFRFDEEAAANLRERFMRAAYRAGVSFYNVAYINYSHQDADIDDTLDRLAAGLKDL